MNRKQFLLLLVLVLIIGGAGLMVRQHGNRSWDSSASAIGGKLLPGLAVNDIARITLHAGTNELQLVRQDNLWRVRERGNYPANFPQISEWLIKLADLKIAQSQEVGPSQLGRFSLLPPSPATNTATLVEFADASGKVLNTLLLGKKHLKKPTGNLPAGMGDEAWPDGRYVMVGGAVGTLEVVADPLENAEPKADLWLNKDFLNVEKPSAITVQFPEATNSWTLARTAETNDWQLAAAGPKEKLDPDKISGVTSPLSSASFSDVLAPGTQPSPTNATQLTVTTFDGFTYTAQIGAKQVENYPVTFIINARLPAVSAPVAIGTNSSAQAKATADAAARRKTLTDKLAREQQYQHWTYLVPTYVLDPLLKSRGELLVMETNSTPEVPATAVEAK